MPEDESEEARKRKAVADSLRRQIEDLKAGRPTRAPAPKSLRDFVGEKMAEDKKKKSGQ